MQELPWLIGGIGVLLCGLLGFLVLLPRIGGIQSTGANKVILIVSGVVQSIIFLAAFVLAGSTGLFMSVWAALGGGGSTALSFLYFLLATALVFVYVVTVGLIALCAGSNAFIIERKSAPFKGAAAMLAVQVLTGFVFLSTSYSITVPCWGYIDKSGQYVIKPKFAEASEFKNGVAVIQEILGPTRYINKQGEQVPMPSGEVPRLYTLAPTQLSLTDDPAAYEEGGQFSAGRWVIKKDGLELLPFSEGLAAARHADARPPGPWGFVDENFKFVIPEQFDDVRHFKEGSAPAATLKDLSIRWGYIDKKGKWVIQPIFSAAYPFSEELGRVAVWDERGNKQLWGYVKPNGEYAIEPQYQFTKSFKDGLAPVFK